MSAATDAPADNRQALATTATPRTPATDDKPKRSLRVTGKLKDACDLMVFGPLEGDKAGCALAMDEAARAAGLSTRAIRLALDKPHVRQYLNQQKQVFRASASAQNISALLQLRDKIGNAMAQLGAIKLLEQTDEETERKASARTPGVVIQIVSNEVSLKSDAKTLDLKANPPLGTPFGGEFGGDR